MRVSLEQKNENDLSIYTNISQETVLFMRNSILRQLNIKKIHLATFVKAFLVENTVSACVDFP